MLGVATVMGIETERMDYAERTELGAMPAPEEIPHLVAESLERFFRNQDSTIAAIGEPVSRTVGMLEQYVLGGGKRIRPLYAWAGFLAGCGPTADDMCFSTPGNAHFTKTNDTDNHVGKDQPRLPEKIDAVINAISSLELIQACALIHDDIIDSSDTRRGNPTVHRVAERRHMDRGWLGDSGHFGHSVGILVGDLAMVWADDLFHGSGLSSAALSRALPAWRGMRTEVIGGQLLDITVEASGSEDIDMAHTVNRFKTAAYTIERPLHIGASIAGASDAVITALRAYGTDIGVAFQLRDDQLGVFGDPSVTGKPAGDDLREGKRTVLVATALALAEAQGDHPTAALIRSGLGRVTSPEAIAELTEAIRVTGAAEDVEKQISMLTDAGLAHLDSVDLPESARKLLHVLADRATARRT